jgi:hypothetical protein
MPEDMTFLEKVKDAARAYGRTYKEGLGMRSDDKEEEKSETKRGAYRQKRPAETRRAKR